MRNWISLANTLSEGVDSINTFITAARQLPDMHVDLEPHDDSVHVVWISGSNRAMPRLCELADTHGVALSLVVEVYSQEDGGRLVPYYERCGFEIMSCENGILLTQE